MNCITFGKINTRDCWCFFEKIIEFVCVFYYRRESAFAPAFLIYFFAYFARANLITERFIFWKTYSNSLIVKLNLDVMVGFCEFLIVFESMF